MRCACKGLAWPIQLVACALLLACAHADTTLKRTYQQNTSKGICQTMDIRNSADQIKKLSGCRVIEGQLNLVLLERATTKDFENISFPELREVTDYIIVYRVRGIQSLGDLFPNLTVIRGMQLYKDFALVVFDNENLESLGLRSLMKIERGGVRIQQNDKLCYTNTIDWTRILSKEADNIIRLNYDTRLCGLCPNAQSRIEDHRQTQLQCPSTSTGRLLCWDDKHCQKVCHDKCEGGCMDNGTCCHPACLGGCSGPTQHDCDVCRNYSFHQGPERICVDSCPPNTYTLSKRCVTEQECRETPPPLIDVGFDGSYQRLTPKIRAYKIHNKTCVYVCPSGYMEKGDLRNSTCEKCDPSGCVKECDGGKIDSVAAAEQFHGCTHIKGTLEIALRGSGGKTLAVLEESLAEVREITGSLLVIRAYPLVSLMFLRKLKKITGTPETTMKHKGQVLHIFNNPNLELLWDWATHGPIDISGGSLFIHLNPKLCFDQILPLKNMTRNPKSNFTEIEVSEDNNGNQASCSPEKLLLNVSQMCASAVVLTWNIYCPDDLRKLLGYSVYYIATEDNVTLYEQRDACSDIWNVLDLSIDEAISWNQNDSSCPLQASHLASTTRDSPWNVLDITMEETRNGTREVNTTGGVHHNILMDPCHNMQPSFYLLSHLTPYTRYAAYVKTYTTSQDKKGAQSSIIYFRTLPGKPSPPAGLQVGDLKAHSGEIKWQPPALPNGTIILYHVEVHANNYNKPMILTGNTNYCANPNALVNMIIAGSEENQDDDKKKHTTGNVTKGSCACDEKPRFNSEKEEERMETIIFENSLQNQVYKKTDRPKPKTPSKRIKRSIDHTLNSMLVKLTEIDIPKPGMNYTNTTDEDGYVKSLYFELDGKARNLTLFNMRHFTWYTVNVWACRVKHESETEKDYQETWCSDRAFQTFRTLEQVNADTVTDLKADVILSNKTLAEVNVTWKPPRNPNGFVVAYTVHYSRIDNGQGQDVGLHSCITADEYEAGGRGYALRNLAPGNYSVEVAPVTAAGAGNLSALHPPVYIPERWAGAAGGWAWALGGCALVAAALAALGWYVRRALLPPSEPDKLFASVNPEYVSTVYVPDEWEVPRANVEFIRELGQGSFGMVYEGLAKNIEKGKPETRCAVKTVNEHATNRERQEFLNEASVMKAFDTFHVVRLLGVVSRGQPTLVIMELMECGDLKSYLRSHRPDADASKGQVATPPTLQNILQMAIEIADGMAYLSAKKFVHRDLAARNCMVAGDLTVKVGDFGMTRDIYETDYYRKGTKGLLPVRWMSPESLKDGVFSSSTDVWSYGVVLWEMATLAMQPYQGLSNEQVVRYVVEGGVMERPEHCPDRLYELMRACWAHRPTQRPSFLQLAADLAPSAAPHFRHRSFFHSPRGQDLYALQREAMEEEQEMPVNVGAVATGSGSNLFGVSGRLASWVRELSSLRSRADDDAAAEPLQPLQALPPNGTPAPPR